MITKEVRNNRKNKTGYLRIEVNLLINKMDEV